MLLPLKKRSGTIENNVTRVHSLVVVMSREHEGYGVPIHNAPGVDTRSTWASTNDCRLLMLQP
jgi:hypothetical protein